MTCNDILELVSAECDGAASAEERRAIEAHLASCAACAAAARELRAAVEAVRGLPPEVAPADMASRVGHALERERMEVAPPVSRFRLVTRRVMPVAMAAAALLIVALLNTSIFIAQAVKSPSSGRLQSETAVASRPADRENQDFESLQKDAITEADRPGQYRRGKKSDEMSHEPPPSIAFLRAQAELERKSLLGLPLAVSREFSQSAPRPVDAMNHVSSLLSDLRAQYEVSKQPDGSYVFDVTMDAAEGEQLPAYLANLQAGDAFAFGSEAKERRRAGRLEKAAGARSAAESEGLSALPEGGVSHTGGAIALGGGWSMEQGGDVPDGLLRGLEDKDAGRQEGYTGTGGLAVGAGGAGGGSRSAPAETETPLTQGKANDRKAQGEGASLAGKGGADGGAPGRAADEKAKAEEAGLAMAGEETSRETKKSPPAADKGLAGKSLEAGAESVGSDSNEAGEPALAAGDMEDLAENFDTLKEAEKANKIVTEAESARPSAPPAAPPAPRDPGAPATELTDSSIALPPGAPPPASAAPADKHAAPPASAPAKAPARVRIRIRIVPK